MTIGYEAWPRAVVVEATIVEKTGPKTATVAAQRFTIRNMSPNSAGPTGGAGRRSRWERRQASAAGAMLQVGLEPTWQGPYSAACQANKQRGRGRTRPPAKQKTTIARTRIASS